MHKLAKPKSELKEAAKNTGLTESSEVTVNISGPTVLKIAFQSSSLTKSLTSAASSMP